MFKSKKILFIVIIIPIILILGCSEIDKKAYYNRGHLFFQFGKLTEALSDMQKAESISKDGQVLIYLGWLYYLKNQNKEALQAFQEALRYKNDIQDNDFKLVLTGILRQSSENQSNNKYSKDIIKALSDIANGKELNSDICLYLGLANFYFDNDETSLEILKNCLDSNSFEGKISQITQIIDEMINVVQKKPNKEESLKKILGFIILYKPNLIKESKALDVEYSEVDKFVFNIEDTLKNEIDINVSSIEDIISNINYIANKNKVDYFNSNNDKLKSILRLLGNHVLKINDFYLSFKMINLLYSINKSEEMIDFIQAYSNKLSSLNQDRSHLLPLLKYLMFPEIKKLIHKDNILKDTVRLILDNFKTDENNYNIIASISFELEIYDLAIQFYNQAIDRNPDEPSFYNNLSWLYSTAKDKSFIDKKQALLLALKANELSDGEKPFILDTLAEAYYVNGEYKLAIEAENKAISNLKGDESKSIYEQNLKKYQSSLTKSSIEF